MAMCETGYRCDVCREDVETISQSDLYLRFVIGELDPEVLHTAAERHIRCNPVLAQFIDHPDFEPVSVSGPFDRMALDPAFVSARQKLVSRGYARLVELEGQPGEPDVTNYPLPDVLDRYR
jgi:hypothetical protein